MLTIILFLSVMAISFLIGAIGEMTRKYDSFGGFVIFMVATICLVFATIAIPIKRKDCKVEILKFKSFEQTLKDQRLDSVSSLERATLTLEIIKQNEWLVEKQYDYKNTWTNWYTTKEVMTLNPIK